MFSRIAAFFRRRWYQLIGDRGDATADGTAPDEGQTTDEFLTNGVLDSDQYSRSDISVSALNTRLSEVVQGVYGDDLDELVTSDAITDPADLVVGQIIWKIAAGSIASFPVFAVLTLFGFPQLGLAQTAGLGILGSASVGIFSFSAWLVIATGTLSDEGKAIDVVLPEALSFMYAQSQSDVNYLNIIRSVALAEDAYGPVANEFQMIVRRCEYFGADIEESIERQAQKTPSDDLEDVLLNLLSHIRNGANITDFFQKEAQKARQNMQQKEGAAIDLVETVSTVYKTASIMPPFLLAAAAAFTTFEDIPPIVLYSIAYGAIPVVTIFGTALVGRANINAADLGTLTDYRDRGIASFSNTNSDGDSYTAHRTLSSAFGREDNRTDRGDRVEVGHRNHKAVEGVFKRDLSKDEEELTSRFDKLPLFETLIRIRAVFRDPIGFFTERPRAALLWTVPVGYLLLELFVALGVTPALGQEVFITQPVEAVFWWVFVPLVLMLGPMAVFDYLSIKREREALEAFPETLRRISSASDSGQSLTDAIISVGENGTNRIDQEMGVVGAKAQFGVPIERALAEFNNIYKIPQVARGTRLLVEAYRASTNVSDVLAETIKSSEVGLQIRNEERSRQQSTVIEIGIISLGASVILLIVSEFFIGLTGGTPVAALTSPSGGGASIEAGGGTGMSTELIQMVLFHGGVLQSILGGIFMGYLSDQRFVTGIKYTIVMLAVTVGMWWVV
jgi:flagellar protein FlaJ